MRHVDDSAEPRVFKAVLRRNIIGGLDGRKMNGLDLDIGGKRLTEVTPRVLVQDGQGWECVGGRKKRSCKKWIFMGMDSMLFLRYDRLLEILNAVLLAPILP